MKCLNLKHSKRIVHILQLSIVLSLLLLSITTTNVYAMPDNIRLAGLDRYETAAAIAKQGWEHSDYAILAFGENFPDALAAAPLAKKYDAPILLTKSASLNAKTKQTLSDLKVKNVFIVGGTSVVSPGIENELNASGLNVTRLAGNDRYDTAIEIAKKLDAVSSIMVVTGENYADALAVGPIAGKLGIPIILVPQDTLPESVKSYISSLEINSSYVVGNPDMISDSVLNQLPRAERIIGADIYERNAGVISKFSTDLASDSICLATGNNFADALTGIAYASKNSLPIVLLPNDLHEKVQNYLSSIVGKLNKVVIFGGEAVVSTTLVNDYLQAIPKVTIKDEDQLVTILNTRANFVRTLYNSNNKVLGLALSQLAGRLEEIEIRLNDSNFIYGDNLINAIKTTDTIVSGIIQTEGLTKTGNISSDYDYTHTIKVLNSLKAKVGIQRVKYDRDQIEIVQAVEFIAYPHNLNEENWLTKLAGGLDKPVSVTYGVVKLMNDGKDGFSEEFIKLSGPNGSEQFLKYSGSAVFESGQSLFLSSKKIVDKSVVKDFTLPIKSLTLSRTVDSEKRFKSITFTVSDDGNFVNGSWKENPHTGIYDADIVNLNYISSS